MEGRWCERERGWLILKPHHLCMERVLANFEAENILLPPRDQINEIYAPSILPHTHSYTSFNYYYYFFFYSWAFRYMRTVAYILTALHINDTYFVFEHIYMVKCHYMEIHFFPFTFLLFRKKNYNIVTSVILLQLSFLMKL